MKKTIGLLLAVTLIITLFSGCAFEKKNLILGTWSYQQTTILNVVTNRTYTFNEDGTCEISIEGETQTIDYELDGNKVTLSIQGEKVSGTVKGDTIVLEDDASESSITMERE